MSSILWNPQVSRLGMTKENLQQKKDQLKASALLERELMQQITDTRLGEQLELERRRMDFEPIVEGVQQLTEAVALKVTPSKLADQYIKLIAKAAQDGTKSPKFEDALRAVADDMKNRVANNNLAPEDVPTIMTAISSAPSLSTAFGGWYYSFNQVISLDFNTGAVHVGPPADPASKLADMTFAITPDTGEAIFTFDSGLSAVTFSSKDFQLLFSARPMARGVPSGLSNRAKNAFNAILAAADGPDNDLAAYFIPIATTPSKKEPTKKKGLLDRALSQTVSVLKGVIALGVNKTDKALAVTIREPVSGGRAGPLIDKGNVADLAAGELADAVRYAMAGEVFPDEMTAGAVSRYDNIIQKTTRRDLMKAVERAIGVIESAGAKNPAVLSEFNKIRGRIIAITNAMLADIDAGAPISTKAQQARIDYEAGKVKVLGSGFRMFNATPGGIAEAKRAKKTGGSAKEETGGAAMFNEISRQLDGMNLTKRQKMAVLRKAKAAF